jgi:hypothetical protein
MERVLQRQIRENPVERPGEVDEKTGRAHWSAKLLTRTSLGHNGFDTGQDCYCSLGGRGKCLRLNYVHVSLYKEASPVQN